MADDPFAAIATPTAPAAPPAASGGDPFASIAAPAAPTTPPPTQQGGGGVGGWLARNVGGPESNPIESSIGKGMAKSLSGGLGGILDMITRPRADAGAVINYKAQHPQASDDEAQSAVLDQMKQSSDAKMIQHAQDAAHWMRQGSEPEGFWEHVGAIGEQFMEMVGTDGLLKMAGMAPAAATGMSRAAQAAEDLKNAQQTAQTLAKNKRMAGLMAIGLKAAKEATTMGAQTYAHTEDPTQAGIAAAMGGTFTPAAEGLGWIGRYLQRIAPVTKEIEGVEVPAMAEQMNERGRFQESGTAVPRKMARDQQQATQDILTKVAKRATATALQKVNETRQTFSNLLDPARLLPAPEAEPFTFSLGTTPPVEETTGKIAQSAAKVPRPAAFEPRYTTSSAPTREPIRPGGPTATEGTTGADIRTAQTPAAQEDVARGGGILQTQDPAEAQRWLHDLEELQQRPIHDAMPAEQQAQIEAHRQALQQQLDLYHASRPVPVNHGMMPVDVDAGVQHTIDFGSSGEQIKAPAQQVFQTLDNASKGDYQRITNAIKQARNVLRRPATLEAAEQAQTRLTELNGEMNDLFRTHADKVSPDDLSMARQLWRYGSRMDELHSLYEGMMNGFTTKEATEEGFTRQMRTANAKRFQAWLEKDENQSTLEELIGSEGRQNLKEITALMTNVKGMRSLDQVASDVMREIGRHARFGGVFGLAGGMIAHQLGGSYMEGMAQGALAGESVKQILRYAAVSPRIGRMVTWAASHQLSPQHFAPLIARAIAETMQEQNKGNEEETQQQAPETTQ